MSENKKPEIGKGYYIRCVTYHYAGVLVSETDQHYVLNKAAWIADGGRYSRVLLDESNINECEAYPPESLVFVAKAGHIDMVEVPWKFPLATK